MTRQEINVDICQKPKSPFRTDGCYPNRLRRTRYQIKNAIHNRLYPISPFLFSTLIALNIALLYRYPLKFTSQFVSLQILHNDISKCLSTLLIAFIIAYLPVLLLRLIIKHFYFGYKGYMFEKKGHYSLTTKLWFVFHRLFSKLSPQLFSCEKLLPNLPLPSLNKTIARYLESVEPLLSPDKFAAVEETAQNFLKNEGWKLQGLAWLYWCFTDNYVSRFWEKFAYHSSRKNLLINNSVAHLDLFNNIPANQAVRAAHIVHLEALSMLSIHQQSLSPVANGIVSLSHLWKCHATTRIPGDFIDYLKVYSPSRHVVVYHRGCMYKVQAFDENDRILGLNELTQIFTDILTRDDRVEEVEGRIAVLTTDSRDKWCLNRCRFFLQNSLNRASLNAIESAIRFLVLDEASYSDDSEHPELLENFFKNMLTGNGSNRWADKSLNYVVSVNGRCGGTTEHSIGDGAEFDYLFENFIYTDFIIGYPEKVEEDKPIAKKALDDVSFFDKYVVRLNFDINETMKGEIERCYLNYQKQIIDVDVASLVFREFGKGLIKAGSISPDAFVQMAIQLASFKDQDKFCLTYESASTRFYANSRTETLRPVTKESCAFVRSMLDADCSKGERLELLKRAAEIHTLHNKECMTGKGFDRHLFVLYVISKITGINSTFLDYYSDQPWQLSTSQAPNMTQKIDEDVHPELSWFGAGFGAVSKNGYGICYRFAGNHSICAHITSYKSAENTDSHRLKQHLLQSFHDMSALFRS